MKKILGLIALSVLIMPLAAFADPYAAGFTFDQNVKYGSTGQSVIDVQQFLKHEGYFSYDVTGNFYGITKQAVKDFQTANNLPSTGYFGPLSRGVANGILATESSQTTTTPTVQTQTVTDATTTAPQDPARQQLIEQPQVTTAPIFATSTQSQCRADGGDIWNDVSLSDPRASGFVWFGNSKEFQSFDVSTSSDTTINVTSAEQVKSNGFALDYRIMYWIADKSNVTDDTAVYDTSSLPATFDISPEYQGHKVDFQVFVSYPCLQKYVGWADMKADNPIKTLNF